MQKLTRLAVGFLLLAVVFVMSCGEEATSPTKAKKESDAIILGSNHADTLNSGTFSAEIAQELAGQGVKLSEKSTILVRDDGKEWLITDTENELAYLVTNGGDTLNVQKTGFIDYLGEADQIVEFWETYRKLYNEREITKLIVHWNKKDSDQLYINIAENEMIEASGAAGVASTLKKLSKGHHTTKGDNWIGSPMNEVYIKKRGSQLVASATGPNAFRKPGQTWVYFVKVLGKWKFSKVESIEQRNMTIHTEILIHEQNMTDKIGYFNGKKTRVK